jgi:hypothetical protein
MSELIEEIVKLELEWFMSVRTIYPSRCQEHPKVFELMRRSTYELWSGETLRKYLEHIKDADSNGRNLMTEKYARMDRMIPPLSLNPLIDKIVEIESGWTEEIFKKYPHIFRNDSLMGFKIYLKSELETYSDEVLESYYRDLEKAKNEGRNLVQEKYLNLFKKLGYKSLEEVNDSAKEKNKFH